jgi:hypothetical protein
VPGLRQLIGQDYRQETYGRLQLDAALLLARYPTDPLAAALRARQPAIDSLAAAARQREARRQQRRAQGNAAPGQEWPAGYAESAWRTDQYTDAFGDESGNRYLRSGEAFYGDCLQQATTSPIVGGLLVDSASALHITLFAESRHAKLVPSRRGRYGFTYKSATYTTSQCITVAEPASYTVQVRAADGRTHHLAATNDFDRLDLDAASSRTLHQLLKQGGKLRFAIRQHQQPPIQYRFTIYNADGYEAAYQLLMAQPAPTQPD